MQKDEGRTSWKKPFNSVTNSVKRLECGRAKSANYWIFEKMLFFPFSIFVSDSKKNV